MSASEQIPASPNDAEQEAAKHLTSIRINGRLADAEETSNEAAVDATDDADTRDGRVSRAA